MHLRGPRRRHAAARAGAAGGAAAEDHHPRRRGHRARHRVDVVPQRAAARVGARDGHPHRRRRGRHGAPRPSTPTCSAASPTRTARSATPCGCASSSSRSQPFVALAARAVPRRSTTSSRRWSASSRPGAYDGVRGRLPRRRRVQRRRELPRASARRPTARPGQRLHRPADLLPLHPARRRRHRDDRLTIHDYLWRWDTDWFWCSRAFGAQHPLIRRLWPRRYLRSSFYWKLMRARTAVRHRRPARAPARATAARAGDPGHRGADRAATAEFLDWFLRDVPIEPIWLCPLRLRDDDRLAAVPAPARRDLRQRRLLVDGAPAPGRAEGATNRLIERKVSDARRPQVAVLRRLLHPRGVRPALRRRRLPRR